MWGVAAALNVKYKRTVEAATAAAAGLTVAVKARLFGTSRVFLCCCWLVPAEVPHGFHGSSPPTGAHHNGNDAYAGHIPQRLRDSKAARRAHCQRLQLRRTEQVASCLVVVSFLHSWQQSSCRRQTECWQSLGVAGSDYNMRSELLNRWEQL